MSAGKLNINIEQGATFSMTITIYNPDGSLCDLSGSTFRGQIKKNPGASEIIKSFSFSIQNQTTNRGEVVATISAANTASIVLVEKKTPVRENTIYAYDIERVLPDNVTVERILEGVASISPEVTT